MTASRIAVGVEYDGTRFLGWQTQAQTPTVQSELERALAVVADAPVTVIGAGRTDSGVHAACQVAHFDPPSERSMRSWVLGTNTHLPEDLRIIWAQPVSSEFNARFSASSRRYAYRIVNRPVRPALDRLTHAWEARPLDVDAMHRAAQALVGEHDFSAFRAAACQARHGIRRIHHVAVSSMADRVSIDVEGNAFLHHMVRNIAGSLMVVGRGEQPSGWIAELLASQDRTLAGPTAPACGLTLEQVTYPAAFGLPS